MQLRRRTKTCDYCRFSWGDYRKSDFKGVKFKKIKALELDHSSFTVYADGFMIWKGQACCAWNAKENALKELGVEPFKL